MEWIKQNIEWLFSGVGIKVVYWLIDHAGINKSNILGSIVNRNTFYVDFNDVPWKKLLNKSSQIDIVVHYFHSWIKTNNHYLLEFYNRGGKLRIVLPNPKNKELVDMILQRFPDFNKTYLVTNITRTAENLKKIRDKSVRKDASFSVQYTDDMIWYCAMRFDDNLIISPYEQVGDIRVSAPAFYLPLKKNKTLEKWFAKEYSSFEK